MIDQINEIIDAVCDMCVVDRNKTLSHNRATPLPQVRGLICLLVKKKTGCTNAFMVDLLKQIGLDFTIAGIGSAISKMSISIAHDKVWRERWDKMLERFDMQKVQRQNNDIQLTIVVPKGMKDNVRIGIKEHNV